MNEKYMLVAFNGEPMCFAHVLLNALDMADKGFAVKVIVEGSATGLLPGLLDGSTPFSKQFNQVRDRGLLEGVCKACCAKMGVLPAVQNDASKKGDLVLLDDMSGHPSLGRYIADGYQIITF